MSSQQKKRGIYPLPDSRVSTPTNLNKLFHAVAYTASGNLALIGLSSCEDDCGN